MKILYLSCHSILEFDEVSLFNELGFEVFSPGAYVEPQNPGSAFMRPAIKGLVYDPYVLDEYHKIGSQHPGEDAKGYLTSEFVNIFDAVIVMHLPRWIRDNWKSFGNKKIIWRTIGQSTPAIEQELNVYRDQGLKIVRYSPRERTIKGYIGEDVVIRFYKNPDELKGWNGNNKVIINFTQSLKQRGEHCGYEVITKATDGLPTKIYGPGNEDLGELFGGILSYEEQKKILQESRAYIYFGTMPASYTLSLMEAMMTGVPIVAAGKKFTRNIYPDQDTNEIEDIIQNGVNGFVANDIPTIKGYLDKLLVDDKLAKTIGEAGRKTAIALWGKEQIGRQWQNFLNG